MEYEQLVKKVQMLEDELNKLNSSTTIPLEIERALRQRLGIISGSIFLTSADLPAGFLSAPISAITAPTGGVTQDAEARAAINSIITTLETLDLVDDN